MKQDDRAENVLGEEVTREGLSEEAILELRPEGEEGPGQVFQEGAGSSGGGRSLDGPVKCLQVPAHTTVMATLTICS